MKKGTWLHVFILVISFLCLFYIIHSSIYQNKKIIAIHSLENIISSCQRIEIIREGDGHRLTFEEDIHKETLLKIIENIEINRVKRTYKEKSCLYAIKLVGEGEEWFQLQVGENFLFVKTEDGYSISDENEIKNLVSYITSLYEPINDVRIGSLLQKEEIKSITISSGRTGEVWDINIPDQVATIWEILEEEELTFSDYASDHKKGSHFAIKITTDEKTYFFRLGGGNFPVQISGEQRYYVINKEDNIIQEIIARLK